MGEGRGRSQGSPGGGGQRHHHHHHRNSSLRSRRGRHNQTLCCGAAWAWATASPCEAQSRCVDFGSRCCTALLHVHGADKHGSRHSHRPCTNLACTLFLALQVLMHTHTLNNYLAVLCRCMRRHTPPSQCVQRRVRQTWCACPLPLLAAQKSHRHSQHCHLGGRHSRLLRGFSPTQQSQREQCQQLQPQQHHTMHSWVWRRRLGHRP